MTLKPLTRGLHYKAGQQAYLDNLRCISVIYGVNYRLTSTTKSIEVLPEVKDVKVLSSLRLPPGYATNQICTAFALATPRVPTGPTDKFTLDFAL